MVTMEQHIIAHTHAEPGGPDRQIVLDMRLTNDVAAWETVIAQLRQHGIRRKRALLIIGRAQEAAQAKLDAQEEKRWRMSEAWREAKERMARHGRT